MDTISIQNIIIVVLLFIVILSFLGINILVVVAVYLQNIINFFVPMFANVLSTLGYTFGTVVNTTSDVVTETGKTSLDIVNGTIHDVNNVIIDASQKNLSAAINTGATNRLNDPRPSSSLMPVQNPISSGKTQYCLVGEFQSKRGCIEVGSNDLCLSGQLFSSKELCMNPTMTQNGVAPIQNGQMTTQNGVAPFNSVSVFPRPPILPNQPNDLVQQGAFIA
jgi:hypothetical protein